MAAMLLLMNQTTINARFLEQIDIAFFTLRRGLFYISDSSVIFGEAKLTESKYFLVTYFETSSSFKYIICCHIQLTSFLF